jgi:hypothetical protein
MELACDDGHAPDAAFGKIVLAKVARKAAEPGN